MSFRSFHPNIRLRIVLSFVVNTLGNMITPFMAVYLAKTVGTTAAGIAATAGILAGIACAAYGGHLADRIGRKRMMLLSEAIGAVAYLGMALFNSPWLHAGAATMAMTVLVSASWGFGKPAMEAMLIDVATPETRKAVYGLIYWSNNLAISIAGIIGAYLFSRYIFELLLAAGIVSAAAFAVVGWFIAETMPPASGAAGLAEGRSTRASASGPADRALKRAAALPSSDAAPRLTFFKRYKEVFSDRRFMLFFLSGILCVSVEMNMTGYIGIRLEEGIRQAPWLPGLPWTIDGLPLLGLLRTENTIAVVLLSLVIGRWLSRFGDKMLLVALAANVAGYTVIASSRSPALLVAAMAAATIGELIYVPLKQAMVAELVPDHARSSYMAVQSMTNRLGQMLAALYVIAAGFLSAPAMSALILFTGLTGIGVLSFVLRGMRNASASRTAEAAG